MPTLPVDLNADQAERERLEALGAPYGRTKDGRPRKPTGGEAIKAARVGRVPKKVSNYPSGRGKDSKSGLPATGDGWGGPAKGAKSKNGFAKADPNIAPLMRARDPETYRARLEDKQRLAEDAMITYLDVMETSEFEANRLAAATHILNRVEGTPVQRVLGHHETRHLTVSVDAMDPEQRDRLRASLLQAKAMQPLDD